MTSEIDDPSVETDSCDSLERVGYRPWLNGTPLGVYGPAKPTASNSGGSAARLLLPGHVHIGFSLST